MPALFPGNGGRRAHRFLLHHLQDRPSSDLVEHSMPHARVYARSQLLASNPRKQPSRFSPEASSLFSSASAAVGSFASSRIWFVVVTKRLTAGYIFAAADLSSQITLRSLDSLDWVRILRMTCYGIVILGPSLHFWYNFVSTILPNKI